MQSGDLEDFEIYGFLWDTPQRFNTWVELLALGRPLLGPSATGPNRQLLWGRAVVNVHHLRAGHVAGRVSVQVGEAPAASSPARAVA